MIFKSSNSLEKLPDEHLMRLVQEKNAKAFEILYDRYSKLLFSYFLRMLRRDREKAEDFVQDLFSKIIRKPESFDSERNFKTWLYSVAHNMCKNEYAKHDVRKDAHRDIAYRHDATELQNTATEIDRATFQEALKAALIELDTVKQTTFELRFHQELSIQEISEVMECSEGTVKSRIFYTLKFLNEKLKHFKHIVPYLIMILTKLQ